MFILPPSRPTHRTYLSMADGRASIGRSEYVAHAKALVSTCLQQMPALIEEALPKKNHQGWRRSIRDENLPALSQRENRRIFEHTQNLLTRLQSAKNRECINWFVENRKYLNVFCKNILDAPLDEVSCKNAFQAVNDALEQDRSLTRNQKNEIYSQLTHNLRQLVVDGMTQSNEKLTDKVILLQEFIDAKINSKASGKADSIEANQPLYKDKNELNIQAFEALMRGIGEALRSGKLKKTTSPNEFRILMKMADHAERMGRKVANGDYDNSLVMRYNFDAGSLYQELRQFAKELVIENNNCSKNSPAKERMLKMGAMIELLAQHHNTALIAAHYDDASLKLQNAHGSHFTGPRTPGQSISHGVSHELSVGGGIGSEAAGNGAKAKLTGHVGLAYAKNINTDYDGSPEVVHNRKLTLAAEAKAGAGVLNRDLASVGGRAEGSRSDMLFTQHKSYEDSFKALISDTRETYIEESPMLHFDEHPYDSAARARAEIEAVNRVTTVAPLNLIRNLGENVRAFWNTGQGGIDYGKRPFNEITFLKAQGGASPHLMHHLIANEKDPAFNALKRQLESAFDQSEAAMNFPQRAQSNRNHHLLKGQIATEKGQLSAKARVGWNRDQVNHDEERPVGMGAYGKGALWYGDTSFKVALIVPAHEIVKKLAPYYPGGKKEVLQKFAEEHPQFRSYLASLNEGSDVPIEKVIEKHLSIFRDQCARMHSAKALLINNQSRLNPVLEENAWNEFLKSRDQLCKTFGLQLDEDVQEMPQNEEARIRLITNANQVTGEAWTALSLGLAQADLMRDPEGDSEFFENLEQEVEAVDVFMMHPSTAYDHSPIRYRTDRYKSIEMGFNIGASFDIQLPSPIAVTAEDATGSGAMKGLLKNGMSAGVNFTLNDIKKMGHPSPVRNGDFRTASIDLKLQLPALTAGQFSYKIAATVAAKIAEYIRTEPSFEELGEARAGMADEMENGVKRQLLDLLSSKQIPNNLTCTFEVQWHRMTGAENFSHVHNQVRLNKETNHSVNIPISTYAGVGGVEFGISAVDKNSTVYAGTPQLSGAVYGHVLQYHAYSALKPLVDRNAEGQPEMNWDTALLAEQRDALLKMYFSSEGIFDFLDECATLRSEPPVVRNTARALFDLLPEHLKELPELNTELIGKVRARTRGMSPQERMEHFRNNTDARRLFNQYLAQVEFLETCNNYGKNMPGGEGWNLEKKLKEAEIDKPVQQIPSWRLRGSRSIL